MMLYGNNAENKNRRRLIYNALTIICGDDTKTTSQILDDIIGTCFGIRCLYIPAIVASRLATIAEGACMSEK